MLANEIEAWCAFSQVDVLNLMQNMHRYDEQWWNRRMRDAGLQDAITPSLAGAAVTVLYERVSHPDPFDGFPT